MKKITLYWLITLTCAVSTVNAQYVYDYRHSADIFYAARDYYSAAQYYNKALGTFKLKPEEVLPYAVAKAGKTNTKFKDYQTIVNRLAESYRLYNDYGNAEKWYAQAAGFNNPEFPLARYWYAVCLRANGKYQEALEQFKQFKQSYTTADDVSTRATLEMACCEFAIAEESAIPRYTIAKINGNVNEGGANYAPVQLNNNTLLFTSSRPENNNTEKKGNPYVNTLYTSQGTDNNFGVCQKLNIPAAKGMDQGTATISPNGSTMYLTRWNMKGGLKQSAIYVSNRQGNGWTEPKILGPNVNVEGYNSMQPFITTDGKYLLFSSNRPGGMGKNDLWYCSIENGNPGAARNMGTNINSKDEDQAPFYDTEKSILVFSSDGRVGLGGLDFFQCEGTFGNWGTPKNMGKPLNSPKDDIYYAASNAIHPLAGGYISSDRESVCCLEIFGVKKIAKTVYGLILDCDNDLPLTGAKVTLLDTAKQVVLQQVTLDETGRYSFEVDMQRQYKIMAEKENYFSKAIYFNTDSLVIVDSLMNPTICLKHYEIGKAIILKDIYYDFNKATLRDQSKIVLDTVVAIMKDNENIVIEMSAHTDSKGSDSYNMKLSQRRAQSCVDYLIEMGIPPSRMIAKGYGKTRPIAPNTLPNGKDNPDGRQLNRRTEFKVLRNEPAHN
jgi:OOP family OmpA-OmpF porin